MLSLLLAKTWLTVLLASTVGLTEPEFTKVMRGDVVARTENFTNEHGKSSGRGMGAVLISKPIEEIWAVVSRFEDKAEYMPRLEKVEVLDKTPERVRVRMDIDASVTKARYTAVFVLSQTAHTIHYELDRSAKDNTIADTQGSYELFAVTDGTTLLVYRTYVDTGRAIPRFIADYMARRSIPKLLTAIRKRVESGGTYRK